MTTIPPNPSFSAANAPPSSARLAFGRLQELKSLQGGRNPLDATAVNMIAKDTVHFAKTVPPTPSPVENRPTRKSSLMPVMAPLTLLTLGAAALLGGPTLALLVVGLAAVAALLALAKQSSVKRRVATANPPPQALSMPPANPFLAPKRTLHIQLPLASALRANHEALSARALSSASLSEGCLCLS